MAPLREGVSKWCPFISKVFLNLFGVIWDIHFKVGPACSAVWYPV
jgi:hypothetical protein